MNKKCRAVIFSNKAYNAIIRESFDKHPVETGGILLGYILDNGLWIVMEVIPPGENGLFQHALFEYDRDFVNYLGTSVANQYKEPLLLLGPWHRHPGSMDYFSSTDDISNSDFASMNPYGVISGLVNIDPSFRLTMYHLDHNDGLRPRNIAYSTVDIEVGDDLIPEKFFALRYVDSELSELHPKPTHTNTQTSQPRRVPKSPRNGGDEFNENNSVNSTEKSKTNADNGNKVRKPEPPKPAPENTNKLKSQKWIIPIAGAIIFVLGILIGVKATTILGPKESKEIIHKTDEPKDSAVSVEPLDPSSISEHSSNKVNADNGSVQNESQPSEQPIDESANASSNNQNSTPNDKN